MERLIALSGDIYFQSPVWLWLWPLAVVVITWLIYRYGMDNINTLPRSLSVKRYRHPAYKMLRDVFAASDHGAPRSLVVRKSTVYAVATLGIFVALANPYRQGEQLPAPPEYRDTVFLVDSSVSMLRRDYLVDEKRVDRMTMLKGVITHFIDQLDGNRISIVAFSESAYTLVPLTSDYDLLRTMIRRLEPALFTGARSDISKSLLYTLQKIRPGRDDSTTERPALVLVTDVNRPVRDIDPRVAAQYLADQGYRLHVIAIGAPSYEADESSIASLIYHPVSFALLKKIAANGNGKFFWARDIESLQQAMLTIQQAERSAVDAAPRYVPISLYQWPLMASIIWIMVLQLLPTRKRRMS
jgi:Ca-activated chloride channel family protein